MIGKTISHFQVLERIGQGGMGEVYRAIDTRLGREVAIKAIPDLFAKDAQRLARFEREARLLASLNHPYIAAIHDLEEADGVRFLVLELVLGVTLAERLAAGPLPVEEALNICRQIAQGLEAAHEKGVIHRDLKPANVKVTPQGQVKVLDFGLAKVFGPESPASALPDSPTITAADTRQGVILGTAAYMSPEQARGQEVDKRTDIWSFGCVLYETLAGRKAFDGETVSDTLAAILKQDPDWMGLPETAPGRIRELLRRCLQKDVTRRLRDIGDARIEIEETLVERSRPVSLDASSATAGQASAYRGRTAASALAAVALVSALLGGAVTWMRFRPARGRSDGPPTMSRVARLTHDPGLSEWPTWSADGSLLAFASNRGGNFEIYVRRVEGGQEVNITNEPAEDFQPAFSPDSTSVAFVSTRSSRTGMIKIGATFGFEFRTLGGDIWVAPALGGRARRLAQEGNFPVWEPAGGKVAYVSGPEDHRAILEVAAAGGPPAPVLETASSDWEIVRLQYSPGGRWITFESVDERVFLMSAQGGTPRELVRGSSHVWDTSGDRLYYLTRDPLGGTRLQSVQIDESSGTLGENPRTVGLMTGILRDLAISRDGRHLAVSELEGSLNLTRLPLTPDGGAPAGPEEVLSSGQVIDRYPSFSPDGRRIAYASDRLGPEEIWILDLETRKQERLQLPGEDQGANLPYWTRDGRHLIVTRFFPDGTRSLWQVAVDGSRAEELQPPTPGLAGSPVSPDGRLVIYRAKADRYQQLFLFDLLGRRRHQLIDFPGDMYYADWSPDGRWISFPSNASGPLQLWRVPASGGKAEALTFGHDRIMHSSYSPDGRWIYAQPNHQNVYRMPASGGALRPVTRFPESGLFIEEPTISPDGRYLAYCRSNGGSSLWLLTLEASGKPGEPGTHRPQQPPPGGSQ